MLPDKPCYIPWLLGCCQWPKRLVFPLECCRLTNKTHASLEAWTVQIRAAHNKDLRRPTGIKLIEAALRPLPSVLIIPITAAHPSSRTEHKGSACFWHGLPECPEVAEFDIPLSQIRALFPVCLLLHLSRHPSIISSSLIFHFSFYLLNKYLPTPSNSETIRYTVQPLRSSNRTDRYISM